ncbi:MAG: lytic murein transglycosylase [Desulfuromonadales bacterium]|nr:lytic murein transglycosylase [Desulfuromonadales bacterium]
MRQRLWSVAGMMMGMVLLLPVPGMAQDDFSQWLTTFRQEAEESGISPETLDAALAGLQPIPQVIDLDRRQPELTRTYRQYVEAVVSPRRVALARENLERHRPLLEEVGSRYGVPSRLLVALWGVESNFGAGTGSYPVVASLATLAWEGRRGPFFRRQLLQALQIIDEGHIPAPQMTGSWAGAMGQFQFMPSTFRRFAVDYDGDGRKDIWTNPADAFASAANYLRQAGWRTGMGWGQRVQIPSRFDATLAGLKTRRTYRQWRQLGIKGVQGPDSRLASLLLPEGPEGDAFLVTDNFRVLLDWNRSTLFALAVGLLADELLPGSKDRPAFPGKPGG